MNIREWTLPVYTILIQLATGALLMLWIIRSRSRDRFGVEAVDRITCYPLLIIFLTILAAMIGSHFHLSQPQMSILAVLNFGRAWLSREIAFNILYFLAVAGLLDLVWYRSTNERFKQAWGWAAILLGMATVFCMGRIYLLRTQPVWNTAATQISFYGTMFLLGATALPLMMLLDIKFAEVRSPASLGARLALLEGALPGFTLAAVLSGGVILASSLYNVARLHGAGQAAQTSLALLFGLYEPLLVVRILTTLIGLGLLVYTLALAKRRSRSPVDLVLPLYTSCLLVIFSEILGRILFYATHVRLGI